MSILEKYSSFVDTEGVIELFDKYQKSKNDNRTLAAKECDITTKSVYDWKHLKENVKLSTKVKILQKIMEEMPVETFSYLTKKLYDSSTETLMSCLTTLYEQSFDVKDEREYLQHVHEFENISKKYAGLIYKHRDLEVNHMFSKLYSFAKSQNYPWKPHQTVLYDSKMVIQMIPQIISLWIYYGLPISAEELAARNKFPIEFVQTIENEVNKQLLTQQTLESEIRGKTHEERIRFGVYIEGNDKTMISTAAALRRPKTLENKTLGA